MLRLPSFFFVCCALHNPLNRTIEEIKAVRKTTTQGWLGLLMAQQDAEQQQYNKIYYENKWHPL